MKNYRDFDTEDFVWDINFRIWVLSPNREVNAFWEKWLEENPDKTAQVDKAKSIIQALVIKNVAFENEEVDELVSQTIAKIDENANSTTKKIKLFYTKQNQWLKIAALVILIIGVSISYQQILHQSIQPKGVYEKYVAASTNQLIEVKNENEVTLPIQLIDGSLVLLKKGSRISYSKDFVGNTREIYLSGEAFFEVTKNPEKPFLVYANGLVTKVLGTSFTIKAFGKDKDIRVIVKTGRVSVFTQTDNNATQLKNNRELTGMVLTANQQAIYQRQEIRLVKAIVDNPVILTLPIENQKFEFVATPISEVFGILEKSYGVDIVYDEEVMSKCSITAKLGDEPLFEKLKWICSITEASYEVSDGQIIITGKPCK
eukprot:GDKJ01039723.1.p1 GENE.GDKJ01039723.1~~GDKJ01039723.1.p1  ORF type:complete len:372 (-),score=52.07 GDKJ01039723.1:172-1287(-)